MYTIGQIAKICNISTRKLRHYDELGLLKPQIINKQNGYRYYSLEQISVAWFIAEARSFEMPLEKIGEILFILQKGEDIKAVLKGYQESLVEQMIEIGARVKKFKVWHEKILESYESDKKVLNLMDTNKLNKYFVHTRSFLKTAVSLKNIKVRSLQEVGVLIAEFSNDIEKKAKQLLVHRLFSLKVKSIFKVKKKACKSKLLCQ